MLFDDVSDVDGAAVTKLQSDYVENQTVFVVLWELFPHKLDEQFTKICFLILAIWWVKPYNLPVFSISSSVSSIAVIEKR